MGVGCGGGVQLRVEGQSGQYLASLSAPDPGVVSVLSRSEPNICQAPEHTHYISCPARRYGYTQPKRQIKAKVGEPPDRVNNPAAAAAARNTCDSQSLLSVGSYRGFRPATQTGHTGHYTDRCGPVRDRAAKPRRLRYELGCQAEVDSSACDEMSCRPLAVTVQLMMGFGVLAFLYHGDHTFDCRPLITSLVVDLWHQGRKLETRARALKPVSVSSWVAEIFTPVTSLNKRSSYSAPASRVRTRLLAARAHCPLTVLTIVAGVTD
ncbi:hypothetical protein RRG08_044217 [Elysia crispata]|uniref:Uncharacterized protein n=1 Tax=Elysia crispata TaxID=231223 RepID=A0AAE0XWR2_9GAST|nr:hypothetical protein RRG08_044217 [Elysia crispata]